MFENLNNFGGKSLGRLKFKRMASEHFIPGPGRF